MQKSPLSCSLVASLVAEKRTELQQTLVLYKEGRREEALALVETHRGNALMAEIREGLGAIIAKQTDRYEQDVRKMRAISGRTMYIQAGIILLTLLIIFFGGLTVRREMERRAQLLAEMAQARQEAEAANRAKSLFLAAMSHELRTPLNGILGFADLLLRNASPAPLDPKRRRYVAHILESGRHLLRLIEDLLDLAKTEVGQTELDLAPVDMADLGVEVVQSLAAVGDQKGVQVQAAFPEELPAVLADRQRLKQVLYNLVGNGVKFTPTGGRVTVTARALTPEPWIELTVSDTGIGIKPENQERIFEHFTQEEDLYSRQQGGVGLGLALARQLVHQHGGRIQVQSAGRNQGSTFRVFLPLTLPDPGRPNASPPTKGDIPP